MSLPGVLPVMSMKRRVSAPYLSMTSTGSMPLPSDFDILRPSLSRTRPWMNTWRKGMSLPNSKPIMTMRATQKKMMS